MLYMREDRKSKVQVNAREVSKGEGSGVTKRKTSSNIQHPVGCRKN